MAAPKHAISLMTSRRNIAPWYPPQGGGEREEPRHRRTYDIPADTRSVPKNVSGIDTFGNNSVNGRTAYAPLHSNGPGPDVPLAEVREVLLAAMKDNILGKRMHRSLTTVYL